LEPQVFLGFTTDSSTKITIARTAQAKRLVQKVDPIYPPQVAADHVEGTVKFHANVGRNGTVLQLQIMSGPTALLESASMPPSSGDINLL